MTALYAYKDPLIKKILWEAKYYHKTQALTALIEHSISDIEEYISSYSLSEKPVPLVIIPIPTSEKRRKIRGYNIPTIIAKHVAKELDATCSALLVKKRNTKPQSKTKNREARLRNVRGSLAVKEGVVLPTNALIILVDDIITSGATAQEAQRALKEQGYNAIVIALAHGS